MRKSNRRAVESLWLLLHREAQPDSLGDPTVTNLDLQSLKELLPDCTTAEIRNALHYLDETDNINISIDFMRRGREVRHLANLEYDQDKPTWRGRTPCLRELLTRERPLLDAADSENLVHALLDFLGDKPEWIGTATELNSALSQYGYASPSPQETTRVLNNTLGALLRSGLRIEMRRTSQARVIRVLHDRLLLIAPADRDED